MSPYFLSKYSTTYVAYFYIFSLPSVSSFVATLYPSFQFLGFQTVKSINVARLLYNYRSKRRFLVSFIYITISQKHGTLMNIIAISPGKQIFRLTQIHRSNRPKQIERSDETQNHAIYVVLYLPRKYGDIFFLFKILDAKIPKITHVTFKK